MFRVGDWVQITPTPDMRWNVWHDSRDIYDNFLDKIGVIEFISDDEDRPGHFLYAVKVNFPDGFGNLDAGSYYEWFRDYHLILSSKGTADLRYNMAIAGKELQEWEQFKKNSTDKMLKHIFAPESRPEPIQQPTKTKTDDPNQWDIKTPPDDNYYDQYPPDYNSSKPLYQYDDNDLDFYYLDISDVKTKDKD
jgi:hypothetical protein